ncbi:MAG TPA: DNA mismatch repair protein MutS, partial [Bradyrhizobium sp.]|nr:DNA mismatch repair protein MutS [Bradyrhizobium sp.]
MKRRSSTSIPELTPPPRRKRGLSEEERALWESVVKQAKPLRRKHRAASPPVTPLKVETGAVAKVVAQAKPVPVVKASPPMKPAV